MSDYERSHSPDPGDTASVGDVPDAELLDADFLVDEPDASVDANGSDPGSDDDPDALMADHLRSQSRLFAAASDALTEWESLTDRLSAASQELGVVRASHFDDRSGLATLVKAVNPTLDGSTAPSGSCWCASWIS